MAIKTANFIDPFDNAQERGVAGVFGMWVFIAVVAMIFLACILGYLVVRFDQPPGREWMPEGTPGLPPALLLSTVVLLISSYTVQMAVRAARFNRQTQLRYAMGATLGLALLFLAVQALAWKELWTRHVTIESGLYAWTFYVLTGVHALHVIGGIPPMVQVFRRSMEGRYTPTNFTGVVLCAMYWHALDVIWIVLYATLWICTALAVLAV
ncbi:MAG: heme-copper oxidase subunit III [Planctomycetota bacterium]|nr:MAG: heme-copper oxidase subunit III [Planctomycetota bacterium]